MNCMPVVSYISSFGTRSKAFSTIPSVRGSRWLSGLETRAPSRSRSAKSTAQESTPTLSGRPASAAAAFASPLLTSLKMLSTSQCRPSTSCTGSFGKRWISSRVTRWPSKRPKSARPLSAPRSMARNVASSGIATPSPTCRSPYTPNELVPPGADGHDGLSVLKALKLDALCLFQREVALGNRAAVASRHVDNRRGVGRDGHPQPERTVYDLPLAGYPAAYRVVLRPSRGQSSARAGVDDDVLVPRASGLLIDPGHVAVEPLAHRAQRVVVKGVHVGRLEPLLLGPAVPALPDGCRPLPDRVPPRGIGVVV